MAGFGDRLRRFKPSRKQILVTVTVLGIVALVAIEVAAWRWQSSIIEGLRALWLALVDGMRFLWRAYIARRDLLNPLVPLIPGFLTALVALVAARIALGQMKIARMRHEAQTEADRQRRVTESFTKAVEQLGQLEDAKLMLRLGGIYALERIAQESDQDYWPIMEILTAFVRKRAPWKDEAAIPSSQAEDASQPSDTRLKPTTDVAAALTVIRRRTPHKWELERAGSEHRRLDLQSTDLRGAVLSKVHLEEAILVGAHLEGAILLGAYLQGATLYKAHLQEALLSDAHLQRAILSEAHLQEAFLSGAHLQGANLDRAQLQEAFLNGANLQGANFAGAHLEGADFGGAHLEGADFAGAHLEGADLRHAMGLTDDKIKEAFGDAKTKLPKAVERPKHWPEPAEEDS